MVTQDKKKRTRDNIRQSKIVQYTAKQDNAL